MQLIITIRKIRQLLVFSNTQKWAHVAALFLQEIRSLNCQKYLRLWSALTFLRIRVCIVWGPHCTINQTQVKNFVALQRRQFNGNATKNGESRKQQQDVSIKSRTCGVFNNGSVGVFQDFLKQHCRASVKEKINNGFIPNKRTNSRCLRQQQQLSLSSDFSTK